jgi:hypothetical protein
MNSAPAEQHDLDFTEIDEIDDIDDDQQLVLIWCSKHRVYEWHWVPIDVAQPRLRKS